MSSKVRQRTDPLADRELKQRLAATEVSPLEYAMRTCMGQGKRGLQTLRRDHPSVYLAAMAELAIASADYVAALVARVKATNPENRET